MAPLVRVGPPLCKESMMDEFISLEAAIEEARDKNAEKALTILEKLIECMLYCPSSLMGELPYEELEELCR